MVSGQRHINRIGTDTPNMPANHKNHPQGGDDMKLFPHQQDALKRTEGFQNVAYYHDMGLG